MSEPQEKTESLTANTDKKFNVEMLIAICAVLISVASFYATYLQANAAEKQVTAMTLPLMNFTFSNVDKETKDPIFTYTLSNKGVGPAKIETFFYKYKDKSYGTPKEYLESCCNDELSRFLELSREEENRNLPILITSDPQQQIVPSADEIQALRLTYHPISKDLWQALHTANKETSVEVCYCSLLDNCYWLNGTSQITETPSCSE